MSTQFVTKYGPWALIAGGSEGIGFSFAEKLASLGLNLILIARRADTLAAAAEIIQTKYSVQVHCFSVDLTSPTLGERIVELAQGFDVGLLIYNAGAAHGAGLFLEAGLESAEKLIALNCRGPLLLSHHFGNVMCRRGGGGIILLSSMSGLAGGAYIATYAATKAFDTIFAEGLWAELRPHNIDVLSLIAGATRTPAMLKSEADFGDYNPMSSDEVAEEGLAQLGKNPVWVAGEANKAASQMLRGPDREKAIEYMSRGAATLYHKPILV